MVMIDCQENGSDYFKLRTDYEKEVELLERKFNDEKEMYS